MFSIKLFIDGFRIFHEGIFVPYTGKLVKTRETLSRFKLLFLNFTFLEFVLDVFKAADDMTFVWAHEFRVAYVAGSSIDYDTESYETCVPISKAFEHEFFVKQSVDDFQIIGMYAAGSKSF